MLIHPKENEHLLAKTNILDYMKTCKKKKKIDEEFCKNSVAEIKNG